MKANFYNHTIEKENKVYYYNALFNSLFSIPLHRKDIYDELINNPEEYIHSFPSMIKKLKKHGFIVDDDFNESIYIKHIYHLKRRDWEYALMILPTYQCNLRCWYCVQKHKDIKISPIIIEAIKRRIKLRLSEPNIKQLRLIWFGGEPLLAYDVIVEITKFAKEECERLDKTFYSDITTNSTLLTKERIYELHNIGIKYYQITIDGERNFHNNIKNINGKSAFDIALNNINIIAQVDKCTLRFNYTNESLLGALKMLEQIHEIIENKIRKNIRILICKVWQEDLGTIDYKLVENIITKFREYGFDVKHNDFDMCYADQYNFECILPNGKVGLCDNEDIENMPGLLQNDGNIIWNIDIKSYKSQLFENVRQKVCETCKYLPICWGPCPKNRFETLNKTNDIPCQFFNKQNMEDLVILKIKALENS